jgi:hypothetical protein
MQNLNVSVSLSNLAELIFVQNANDAKLLVSLSDLKDEEDLFYFCVHLLCKGLILCFGHNNRIELEAITAEQLETVKRKLGNMGVICNVIIEQTVNCKPEIVYPRPPQDGTRAHFESMKLLLKTPSVIYTIFFKLSHVI